MLAPHYRKIVKNNFFELLERLKALLTTIKIITLDFNECD